MDHPHKLFLVPRLCIAEAGQAKAIADGYWYFFHNVTLALDPLFRPLLSGLWKRQEFLG